MLELKEKIKGKYEIITEPGQAEICVVVKGKEIASREIILNNGLNAINIEI